MSLRSNLILFIFLITISSCKKDEPVTPIKKEEPILEMPISGKWLLVNGIIYVENLDTHERIRYNHFDANKARSSLRFLESPAFDIENLELNKTTWSIWLPQFQPGTGRFLLNGDTSKPYGFYVTSSNWTIVESPTATASTMQMGGSARPIQTRIHDYSNKIISVLIQEGNTSSNNQNFHYQNELYFKKIEEW